MANEHSQIVPSMQPTAKVADFKFWCQKVLPLVYDDSLSYYEVLNKMVVYLNQVIDNINADIDNVAELEDDFLLLQTYVNNFFDDIDQLVTYAERAEAAETAALSSAASAAESATNAASSAVNAATSSGSAATSALSAMDAKDAAVAAKTAAEAALASAQTAATNAANSATAASNSATAASGSATNAAASAASALQNFQLSDAARVAAQSAASSAEESASDAQEAAEAATSASGNITKKIENIPIARFDDGLSAEVKSLIVDIEPVQSGTEEPSPVNIRPITGWTGANVMKTGKNLLAPIIHNGVPYNANIGSEISFSPPPVEITKTGNTYSAEVSSWNGISICSPKLKPNIPYKIHIDVSAANTRSSLYFTDENFVIKAKQNSSTDALWDSNPTFEEADYPNGGYVVVTINTSEAGTVNISEPQIEIGSTFTGFEEYKGNTYSVAFPNEAGTVYGGTLDLVNGKLIVDMEIHTYNGSENWSINNAGVFNRNLDGSAQGLAKKGKCNILPVQTVYSATTKGVLFGGSASDTYIYVCGFQNDITTVEDFKTFLSSNNMVVCYPIATPIEYDITPQQITTLLGTNNIWADTGNVHLLEYFTNAENYVTQVANLVKAIIAPVLKDMIADTALVANDFRIVGNTLYRISGNIASGGTLTPNTNCVATTVGEILKSLLSA